MLRLVSPAAPAAPAGLPSRLELTLTVYAALKSPLTTACVAIVVPPILQTESTVTVRPLTWMSRLEQSSRPIFPKFDVISLSVAALVHCCMVIAGMPRPSMVIFISHKPALRTGISSDAAGQDRTPAQARIGKMRCERWHMRQLHCLENLASGRIT